MNQPNNSPKLVSRPGTSPILAAVLAFLYGLGHLYNGQITKYPVIFLLMWVGVILCFLPGVFIWILNIIDAYQTAERLESGESIPENEYSLPLLYDIVKVVDKTATCSRSNSQS